MVKREGDRKRFSKKFFARVLSLDTIVMKWDFSNLGNYSNYFALQMASKKQNSRLISIELLLLRREIIPLQ